MEFLCDGEIVLSNTLEISNDTILDCTGHNLILNGNTNTRILYVNSGVTLVLTNLTFIGGSSALGGAIFNNGGTAIVAQCQFLKNQVVGTNGIDNIPAGTNQLFSHGSPGEPVAGGAVYSLGDLQLYRVLFKANSAAGGNGGNCNLQVPPTAGAGGGDAQGGAVYSFGSLTIVDSLFDSNTVVGGKGGDSGAPTVFSYGGSGGNVQGGAIWASGSVYLTNTSFANNSGLGGRQGFAHVPGGVGGASGGALLCAAGNVTGFSSIFIGNTVHGQYPAGGAICTSGTLQLQSCNVRSNSADAGGGIYHTSGSASLRQVIFDENVATIGGGMFNQGTASFALCSFTSNSAAGSKGARSFSDYDYATPGGSGGGGGLWNKGAVEICNSAFISNLAIGGAGGDGFNWPFWGANGGPGQGGALGSESGSVSLINCTIAGNGVYGGAGGSAGLALGGSVNAMPGPPGVALGGGIYLTSSSMGITNCTIAANAAFGGRFGTNMEQPGVIPPIGPAFDGGIAASNSLQSIKDTIVSQNGLTDVDGSFTGDHNLIGIDARLGDLGDHGGPTLTFSIMPDSLAIDAADPVSGIQVDQRGVPRPFGLAPDIGAYEWTTDSYFLLKRVELRDRMLMITGLGPTNRVVRLQVRSNSSNWQNVGTNTVGSNGEFQFQDTVDLGSTARLYRTASP